MGLFGSTMREQMRRTTSFLDTGRPATTEPRPQKAPGRKHYYVFIDDQKEKRTSVRVTPNAVPRLADLLAVHEREVLKLSHISLRTFARKKAQAEPLSATESDRLLRIARIAARANEVFGDSAKAQRWLSKRSAVLGGIPLEMLATDSDAREVEEELERIEQGDFA